MNPLALSLLKKYLKKELEDCETFCVLAVGLGYLPTTKAKMLKLVKAATKHVLAHGTPTEADVRAALGL